MSHTILYPIPSLGIGGAEQQLLELVRALDKRRYRPIVAPLNPGGALEDEFRAVAGAEIVQLQRQGRADPRPVVSLAALLRSRQIDVIQPYLSPATALGMVAGLLAGTPVRILTERSGVGRHMSFYVRLQDRLSRFASVLIANSEAGRESLIMRGVPPERIHVIVNGINLDRLHSNPDRVSQYREQLAVPQGGKVVGILASLLPVKLHETFLRAGAALAQRQPDLRFAIFGDGPLRADLELLAADLRVAEHTVFFGYQRDVADCLGACDLLVSTSRVEGLSNAVLEAMALGVPVVASDIPGNRELVKPGRTGCLVPVGDHAALASAMEHAFAHPVETGTYARQARDMIRIDFSVERMAREHEALYDLLLQRSPYPAVPGRA